MRNLKHSLLILFVANMPVVFCVNSNSIHGIKNLNHLEKKRLVNANLSKDETYLRVKERISKLTSMLREIAKNKDPKYDAVRKETREILEKNISLKEESILAAKRDIPFRLLTMDEILKLDKQRKKEIALLEKQEKLLTDYLNRIDPILDNQTKRILKLQADFEIVKADHERNKADHERNKADFEIVKADHERNKADFEIVKADFERNRDRLEKLENRNRVNRIKAKKTTNFSYINPYTVSACLVLCTGVCCYYCKKIPFFNGRAK